MASLSLSANHHTALGSRETSANHGEGGQWTPHHEGNLWRQNENLLKIKLNTFTISYQITNKTIYRGIQDSQYPILQWVAREIITPGHHLLLTSAPLTIKERTPLFFI